MRYLLLMLVVLPASARSEPVILVVGDSISAGFGVPVQQGWVALLQQELQQDVPALKVINASISGDTTAGGVNRLPALLQQYQPELTIIELGGNDGLRGMPLQHIRSNLLQMVKLSRAAGSDVLLLGMQIPPNYGPRYSDGFRQLYHKLAEAESIPLLPFLLDGIATRPELMQSDGIHPVTAAQPLMAAAVRPLVLHWLQH